MKKEIYQCCICGKLFRGYGNNPIPVKPNGKCCDSCNVNFVIPARITGLANKKEDKNK